MISLVIGRFDFAGGLECSIGSVIEQGMCQRSADALVEQDEHEGGFEAFVGEPVTVATSDALEESVSFQLAKIVAELVEGVGGGGQAEGAEGGLVDVT